MHPSKEEYFGRCMRRAEAGHIVGIITGIMNSKIVNMLMWQIIKEKRDG